jgi:hypothetical protein
MRILFLSILCLAVGPSLTHSQKWTKHSIDDIGQVEFPGQPDVTDTLQERFRDYIHDPRTYYFFHSHYKMKLEGFQSNDLLKFYDYWLGLHLEKYEAKLKSKKIFIIDSLVGLEALYNTSKVPQLGDLVCERYLLLDNTLHSYGWWVKNDSISTTQSNRDYFINSFTLNKSKKFVQKIGYTKTSPLKKLFVSIGLLSLLVLIIVIAVRLLSKKKH